MKKQNLLVLGIAVALIAAVAVAAAVLGQNRELSHETLPVGETALSTAEPAPEQAAETVACDAYLVVTVGGVLYEPIPLSGEGAFTIRQSEETSNTVHVTPDSVWMEHSSCDNQDCVDQGTVSLENMNTRVLSNMIICLPNEVVLELHTPESLESAFGTVQ